MYKIFTDGAVSGNGKKKAPGGWAYVILKDNKLIGSGSGGEIGTTNQRMELLAALNACREIEKIDAFAQVEVFSDSAYFVRCFTENWWKNWEKNDWKNSKKEPVVNQDLWKQLIFFFKKAPNYNFLKVKGHQGTDSDFGYWNDFVDKMAVRAKNTTMEDKNG